MKKLVTKSIVFTSLIAMGFLHMACGTPGTTWDPLPNEGLNYDFRIVSSTPMNGSTGVSTNTTTMQVFLSEAVNPATIPNNIQVATNQGGTNNFSAPISVNPIGSMLEIEVATSDLQENVSYTVVFFPGLQSITNNAFYNGQFPQGLGISFNTGTGYGNSHPGPPTVTNISRYAMGNGCFAAIITFSEDVNLFFNDVRLERKPLIGNGWAQISSTIQPLYTWGQHVWIVQGTSCSPAENSHRVIVQNAVDLDGNQMTSPASVHCESTVNIFNGAGQCN